jgi:alkanesulfonate monooxygenase SsuD/methylene tetrahydromethanopterin reductase-like flavin-dependent oxidoreductase (luciferase family)
VFGVGVGVGVEFPEEYQVCGVPMEERGTRLTESLTVLSKLWTGEPGHARRPLLQVREGRHAAAATPGRRPADLVRRPLGRGAEARMIDGWMSYVVTPDMFRQSLDKFAAAADAAGRVFERGFASAHLLFTRVDRTYEDALEAATKSLSRRYAMDFRRAAQRYCALDRPQEVVETIRRFYEAGARHVIRRRATSAASALRLFGNNEPVVSHIDELSSVLAKQLVRQI